MTRMVYYHSKKSESWLDEGGSVGWEQVSKLRLALPVTVGGIGEVEVVERVASEDVLWMSECPCYVWTVRKRTIAYHSGLLYDL